MLLLDLDQAQSLIDKGVEHRLDQGGLSGAAGAPEQGVVGRSAAHELPGVAHDFGLLGIHAQQVVEIDPVRMLHRYQPQTVPVIAPAIRIVGPVRRHRAAVQDAFPAIKQMVGAIKKVFGVSHIRDAALSETGIRGGEGKPLLIRCALQHLQIKQILIYCIHTPGSVGIAAAGTTYVFGDLTMKKIIAIAALIASAQASAFWGWNDNSSYGYGNAYNNGVFDGIGNGDAEADFTFDFSMTARMRGEGRGNGNGYGYGNGNGYGYNGYAPYYGAPYGYPPVAPMAAPVAE